MKYIKYHRLPYEFYMDKLLRLGIGEDIFKNIWTNCLTSKATN